MRKQSVRNKRKQSIAFKEYRLWYKSLGIDLDNTSLVQGRALTKTETDDGEIIHPFTYIYEKN
jgi:hypothetical protein